MVGITNEVYEVTEGNFNSLIRGLQENNPKYKSIDFSNINRSLSEQELIQFQDSIKLYDSISRAMQKDKINGKCKKRRSK